jgi:sortase (surface protein transpeptidase)
VAVGVNSDKELDVPSADTVGWYRFGAAPGEPGASVLAAHVDYAGVEGAFYSLAQLAEGDTVELVLDDGAVLQYRVSHVYEIQKSELPANELFRKDGAPVLQLITCGGTFNPERQSYEANVVVTAEPLTLGPGTA